VMVTSLGAASIPVIIFITLTGYLLCLLLASFGVYQGLGPAMAIGIAIMLLAGLTLLPALLAIQSGINKPRYATLKGIMGAKSKQIQKLTAADLGLTPEDLAPRQKILKVYLPVKKVETEFLQGSAKEIAAQLVDKLRSEARVI